MNVRPRGYALFEMVAAMSLVGVFIIVAGTLVNQVFAVQREAAQMEWATSRMDFALRELRQDVWAANAIDRQAEERIAIEIMGESALEITWRFESDPSKNFPQRGWLVREAISNDENAALSNDQTMRYEIPLSIEFREADDGGLTVVIDEQRVWLASQVLLGRPEEVTR